MARNNAWPSCGVRTAVGSSRMRIRTSRYSSFRISTRCCWPTESCQMRAVGINREVVALPQLPCLGLELALREPQPNLGISKGKVLSNREVRDEAEVLVDHPYAGGEGILGSLEVDNLTVHQHLAGVRSIEAGDHRAECRLAGTVLSKKRVDFTAGQTEIDVGVGEDAVERLVDLAELDRGRRAGLSAGSGMLRILARASRRRHNRRGPRDAGPSLHLIGWYDQPVGLPTTPSTK